MSHIFSFARKVKKLPEKENFPLIFEIDTIFIKMI